MVQWILIWIQIGNLAKDLNPDWESGSMWAKIVKRKKIRNSCVEEVYVGLETSNWT
jgi:hypothetical protein